MLTRLQRLRRAAEPTLWPDVALAVVLGVVMLLLAVGSGREVAAAPMPPPELAPWDVALDPMRASPDGPDAGDAVMNLLIAGALVGRRRWPVACFAGQFFVLLALDPDGNVATLVAILVGAYSLAVHGRSTALTFALLLAAGGITAGLEDDTWPNLPGWVGVFALLLPVGLTGVAIRAARGRAEASEARAESFRREQEATTALAVAEERARIARELHDVVSHHVSVMTIQAGAAGAVLDTEPELARGALTAIQENGRETMTELRHLLGLLTPGPADEPLEPQPGLAQLDALVDNVRQAGQPVTLRRTPAVLPHGMDLTAYRVVQEALTNALRYAPGARTRVEITAEPPDGLVIEVTNDAAPPGTGGSGSSGLSGSSGNGAGNGAGTGLVGLAERLRLYGGTLEAGRRVGGGFRVRARLPIPSEVAP